MNKISSFRLGVLLSLLAMALPSLASAQDLHESRRPSPVGIAKTFMGDTYLKVTYGRPYMRDRDIFGPGEDYLVPWDEVWRTGANEATEITITDPVQVAGERLDAGTYSIFTVPGEDSWEVRFHSEVGMDGMGRMGPDGFEPTYDPAQDVLVVEIPTRTANEDEPVEQFTIDFVDVGDVGVEMVLSWETTEVRVPIAPVGM